MNRNGAASIVLVFAVLCLTIFAVVSFVPALREDALIVREVARVTAFYAADARAEEIVAAVLHAMNTQGYPPENVHGTPIGSDINWDAFAQWVWFAYPVNEALDLYVSLAIDLFDLQYEIYAWRVVHTGAWEADDRLNVWQGWEEDQNIFFGW